MKFVKYPSLENAYQKKFLNFIYMQGLDKQCDWTVTEKVHGANFAIYVSTDEVKFAKRSGFLAQGESFYNHEAVVEKYRDAIVKAQKFMTEEGHVYPKQIILCGEIYGGYFSGVSAGQRVQKGVEYCPHNDFVVFDAFYSDVDGENMQVLQQGFLQGFCEETGFMLNPVLFRGTLEECFKYSNEFKSTIPALHGLESLEENTCEGVVIKPETGLWWGTPFDSSRIILKNKNAKFSENNGGSHKVGIIEEVPEHIKIVLDKAKGYVNDNRMDAVVSKLGEDGLTFRDLHSAFMKDLLEDFTKDNDDYNALEQSDRKTVNKAVGSYCQEIVRKRLFG
jgi:Rnl2 family RNA ligase